MTEPPQDSTEHRFLHSTVAAYGSQLIRLVVSFAARVALARLLLPTDHGLYELALRIVTIAAAVRDLGLPYHLMRDPRRPYGTVLAFTLISGAVVTGVLVLAAPLASLLNGDLPGVLRVYAVWVLLDGLMVVPRTFFDRELRIRRLLVPEVLRGLITAAISVTLAVFGWGVWSFIYADLAAAAGFAAMVWVRARGQVPLKLELSLVPELVKKSAYLFFIWVAFQLVTYIDVYIIEAFRSTDAVGYYSRAYMIAFLMSLIVAPRALVPALVEYRQDAQRFLGAFRMGTVFLLSFQVLAAYFLFLNAEKVVAILLGDQWGPSVTLLKILCFVPLLDVFTDLGGEVLKVRHEDRTWLLLVLLNLVSLLGFGILFTSRWGAQGMACANFLLFGHLVMAWRMATIFGPGFRKVLGDLAQVYLIPIPFFLVAAQLGPSGSWTRFLASAAAGALALALLGHRFYRPFRSFFGPGRRASVPGQAS